MSAAGVHDPNLENDAPSLPSSETSSSSGDTDQEFSDAERQWQESLQQLELLLTMVLIPYIGKYFGRKLAFWGWAKFMTWKHPVEVVVTDPAYFRGTGAIHAAASL